MLVKNYINPLDPNYYSSSGITGTTLIDHDSLSSDNSGSVGTTDIYHSGSVGTVTCNLSSGGNNVKIYRANFGGGETELIFDANYGSVSRRSFIIDNNPSKHHLKDLKFEFIHQGSIAATFYKLDVFISGIYKLSFDYCGGGNKSSGGSGYYNTISELQVERIRTFDNIYSYIANNKSVMTTAPKSNIGLGSFLTLSVREVDSINLKVHLMHSQTSVMTIIDRSYNNRATKQYISAQFTTPSSITSNHYLKIITERVSSNVTTEIFNTIIPIYGCLKGNLTYYICFNLELDTNLILGTISWSLIISKLSISRYLFDEDTWSSLVHPIAIRSDANYLPSYDSLKQGATTTIDTPQKALIYETNLGGNTGVNGCVIGSMERFQSPPQYIYIPIKSKATASYNEKQAVRAYDLLDTINSYTDRPIQ